MQKTFVSILLCAAMALPGAAENKLSRAERKAGFDRLFDGRTLHRWHSIKQRPTAGHWLVKHRLLTWDKGGMWLATDHTYFDFVLRLDYRTGENSNSGIFLRSLPQGNPAFSGMELQILSDHGKAAGVHSTGSLYGAVAPLKNMAKPDGEWNHVEISVVNRRLISMWNGEKVLDVDLDDPQYAKAQEKPLADRSPHGHIGLQAYGSGAPVEFRNLRIHVLKIGPLFPKKIDEN